MADRRCSVLLALLAGSLLADPTSGLAETWSGSPRPQDLFQAEAAVPAGSSLVARTHLQGSAAILPTWEAADMRKERAEPTSTASVRPARSTPKRIAPTQAGRAPREPVRAPRFPVGIWAPAGADCATLDGSGYLPLLVGSTKAAAGEAICRYKSTEPDGREWRVTAVCSDGSETWTAHIGLEEAAGRLRWTSERGTALYHRCPGGPSSLKGADVGPGPEGDVPGRVTKG